MSEYFCFRLNQSAELSKTPAAGILRTSRILRDDTGDFVIVTKYSYHAEKLYQNMDTAKEILRYVYFIDGDINIEIVCIHDMATEIR